MASVSSAISTDVKTLPKLGPNSVILRKRSIGEEQEQQLKTRAAVREYISMVFGEGPTESEKAFLSALNENGKFSIRLVLYYIFILWYMAAVYLSRSVLEEKAFVVRCKIPALEECLGFYEILDISLMNKTPTLENAVNKQYCVYADRQYSQLVATYSCKYESIMNAIKLENEIPKTKHCEDFVVLRANLSTLFSDNIPTSLSLRDDMKLFCDKDVWNRVFGFAFIYGMLLSYLVLATTADTYGRKRIFIIGSLVHSLSCMLLFLPCKWCIALGFFLNGIGVCAGFSLYVLFLELCSDVTVLWLGLLIVLMAPFRNLLEFILRYTISIWRYLHLASTLMLLVLPFGIWYITESPRWLMFTGNEAAAWKVLKRLESTVVPNDSDIHESVLADRSSLTKILHFFRQPLFRERITACMILYFLTSISLYIMKEEATKDMHFGTEEFYLISFGFQVFVVLATYFSAIKYGRRKTSFVLYCLLIVFDALIFMENQYFDSKQVLPILLYFRNSIKESVSYMLIYYTSEMFPTPYRVTALNICIASSIFGHIVQEHLYDTIHPEPKLVSYMPPFIASITCALIVCFLPKTKNGLPDIPRDALLFKINE